MAGSQSSPALKLEAAHTPAPHLHLAEEVCPLCDQAIPRDRFDEIKDRIETRQRERSAEITSRLETQFAQDKAKALEQARQEADEKVDAARDEGRMAAEAAAREQLAAVAHAHEDAQAALRNELLEAATAKEEAVQLVRQHVVQTHSLRLSNEARTQKTAALYSYITSERSKDLFKRIDSQAEKLLDMQDKEEKTHRDMWKRRGEVLKSIQKVNAEVRNEIDLIIGTADDTETGS